MRPGGAMSITVTQRQIEVDGRTRRYFVERGDSISDSPSPVVLFFHGGTGSGEALAGKMDFFAHASDPGLIVGYPGGYQSSWNAGPGPDGVSPNWGPAFEEAVDDVAFVRALLDDLAATVPVDQ